VFTGRNARIQHAHPGILQQQAMLSGRGYKGVEFSGPWRGKRHNLFRRDVRATAGFGRGGK
jgi:hypothetical protein